MSRIPEINSKQLCKVLLKLGFESRTGKGSHMVFKHSDGRRTVIPMHNRPVRMGTLRAILKQVELEIEEFLKLM